MTVIAASIDEQRMAANEMAIEADGSMSPVHKIFEVRGTLIGAAGDLVHCREAIEWIRADCKGPHPKQGTIILLILGKNKLSTWSPIDGFVDVARRWMAVGTGGPAALAALAAQQKYTGKTDVRGACRIASDIDSNSGGRIVSRRLRTRNGPKTRSP